MSQGDLGSLLGQLEELMDAHPAAACADKEDEALSEQVRQLAGQGLKELPGPAGDLHCFGLQSLSQ